MSDYTPNVDDLVRGFRAPWHSKPEQAEDESFSAYLGRLSVETAETQMADEAAARRGVAKVKADALREAAAEMRKWVDGAHSHQRFTEHELVEHGIEQVLNEYADRIEGEA